MRYFKIFVVLIVVILTGCEEGGEVDILGPGDGIDGVAGSTSRFVVKDDYLYIVTESQLKVIRLGEDGLSTVVRTMPSTDVLETIYLYDQHLFLGGQSGVYIYSLSEPDFPAYVGSYEHQTACDPVVASGDFAYLTLRDGTNCRGESENFLITLDISQIDRPVAVDTIVMRRPRGLSFYQGDLYVGEGAFGLKKFDISTPYEPKLDTVYSNIPCNDLIGLPGHLIITYSSGISQYRSESDSLRKLSEIR